MIIITPDAVEQLRTMVVDGSSAKLEFSAEDDGDGGYNCSVALVGESAPDAELLEVEGIPVAFRGMANSVFAGAVLGLNPEGELTIEMAEGDCDSCGEDGCGCGDDGCGCGGH